MSGRYDSTDLSRDGSEGEGTTGPDPRTRDETDGPGRLGRNGPLRRVGRSG